MCFDVAKWCWYCSSTISLSFNWMNFSKTARYRKLLNTADTHGWGNNIFQTTLLSGSCVWSVCGLTKNRITHTVQVRFGQNCACWNCYQILSLTRSRYLWKRSPNRATSKIRAEVTLHQSNYIEHKFIFNPNLKICAKTQLSSCPGFCQSVNHYRSLLYNYASVDCLTNFCEFKSISLISNLHKWTNKFWKFRKRPEPWHQWNHGSYQINYRTVNGR